MQGQRLFRVNWFYKDIDTAMAVKIKGKKDRWGGAYDVI